MMDRDHLQGRLGCVTCYGCEFDRRFAYYVYLPHSFGTPEEKEAYPLIALLHGTERSAEGYRNKFKRFAGEMGCAILAPLFPAGIPDPAQLDGYHMVRSGNIDFSEVFLHMLDEMSRRFPIDTEKVCLHGFSAGGQFAHRFFYLYPERLRCVSIGSPGNITYPDTRSGWPQGVGGLGSVFGRTWNPDAMRQVKAQIVIGGDDVKPPFGAPDGPGRMELNRRLCRELEELGIDIRFDIVPEAGHNGFQLLDPVMSFFREILEKTEA